MQANVSKPRRSLLGWTSTPPRCALIAAAATALASGIAAYKAKVEATYRSGRTEYERLTPSFFVVSGDRGKDTFYKRVYFTCSGRIISVWSMTYPQADGARYDRIVEAVARSYRPAETPQTCS